MVCGIFSNPIRFSAFILSLSGGCSVNFSVVLILAEG
jgi:hypothetical protein